MRSTISVTAFFETLATSPRLFSTVVAARYCSANFTSPVATAITFTLTAIAPDDHVSVWPVILMVLLCVEPLALTISGSRRKSAPSIRPNLAFSSLEVASEEIRFSSAPISARLSLLSTANFRVCTSSCSMALVIKPASSDPE